MISLRTRLNILSYLGHLLGEVCLFKRGSSSIKQALSLSEQHNSWFTQSSIKKACNQWCQSLSEKDIQQWASSYHFSGIAQKNIALITAGNIPLVGLHDLICILLAGHRAQIKLSSKDKHLLPAITNHLIQKFPSLSNYIYYTEERLKDFDAVIATGNDNSSRYFEHYFRNTPKIIRRNRNSVAIISGKESEKEFILLGRDIFDYFGLGCRNVSKLFVPQSYDFSTFFSGIESYNSIINHHKYANNYTYHKAIYMMNLEPIMDNGFLLLKKSKDLGSPLSSLFYETYDSEKNLSERLDTAPQQLQCILESSPKKGHLPFGFSQSPKLWDYADNVDVLKFLLTL